MEKRKTLVWLPLIDLAESKLAHETLAVELCHLMYFLAKVAMKAAHMKVPNYCFRAGNDQIHPGCQFIFSISRSYRVTAVTTLK
jgi:hypothetical protein